MENYSKVKISVLRLYIEGIVSCKEHFEQTKGMKKAELLEWFYNYIAWHEILAVPSIKTVVCTNCMKIREWDAYTLDKYDCPECGEYKIMESFDTYNS